MAQISIEIKGLDGVINALGIDLDRQVDNAIRAVALEMDNEALENLQDRIYSRPPSPNYVRTGAAQQGREVKKVGRGRKVIYNPQLKGKAINYAPMLNKNSRIPKLHTLFWEDAVSDIKRRANTIAKKHIGFKK